MNQSLTSQASPPRLLLEVQSYKNMMQLKSFEEPGNEASFPCVCGKVLFYK